MIDWDQQRPDSGVDRNHSTGIGKRQRRRSALPGIITGFGRGSARFGDASIGAADKIEASEARITDAYTRIQQAAAGPTAAIATTGADWLEIMLKPFDPNVLQRRIQDRLDLAADNPEAVARYAAEVTLKTVADGGSPIQIGRRSRPACRRLGRPGRSATEHNSGELIGGISSAAATGDPYAAAYLATLTDIAGVLIDDPGRYANSATNLTA